MTRPARSHVVTGGGRGVGRAIVERLLEGGDAVVALELDPAALAWTERHPAGERVIGAVGDASDEAVAERAADGAETLAPLAGWYATAKAATEGMTRALAVEYGGRGLRVNAVALGSIRTERYDAYLAERGSDGAAHVARQMAEIHPLGRVGRSEEVADAVAYLLSERSSFLTGVTLPVDGGRAALGRDPEAYEPP